MPSRETDTNSSFEPEFRPGQPPPDSPSSPGDPGSPSPWKVALSVAWAVLPLVSLGLLTPFAFTYAAVRLRSAWLGLSAAAYLALVVTWFATLDSPVGSPGDAISLIVSLITWLVGTGHALAVRGRLLRRGSVDGNRRALQHAEKRRGLRAQARELAGRDPELARELSIGRPDLPREFDDGGLVDVNHAPPEVISRIPGLSADQVDRIVQTRQHVGPFVSAEELSVSADLPPDVSDELAEYTVYLP